MNKKPNPELTDEENPELTAADFKKANRPSAETIAKFKRSVGRPFSDNPKQRTTIYLDSEIMDFFKAGGKGWQTRVNKVLKDHVEANR